MAGSFQFARIAKAGMITAGANEVNLFADPLIANNKCHGQNTNNRMIPSKNMITPKQK